MGRDQWGIGTALAKGNGKATAKGNEWGGKLQRGVGCYRYTYPKRRSENHMEKLRKLARRRESGGSDGER